MTMEYDAGLKRATHVESGMAVEFDREGLYPQERDTYFRLIWKGQVLPFKAGYDYGGPKIEKLYPDLDLADQMRKRHELNEQNFHVSSLPVDVRRILSSEMPEFGEVFVRLLLEVVGHFEGSSRKSAHFRPFFYLDDGAWSAEG